MKKYLIFGLFILTTYAGISQEKYNSIKNQSKEAPEYTVVSASDIIWGALNPARGKMGPRAANLWGDRTQTGPSGILVKFNDGFSSPPHIHNVTYKAIVLSGNIHNDDPKAENMWMPANSFWIQPKGEIHITAAMGASNLALVEIEEGPYLVKPESEKFDAGERPINVDPSNLVWVSTTTINWLNHTSTADLNSYVAYLWGKPGVEGELGGIFLRLSPNTTSNIVVNASDFKAVVVKGEPTYSNPANSNSQTLSLGSYVGSNQNTTHTFSTQTEDVVLYIRANGSFQLSN